MFTLGSTSFTERENLLGIAWAYLRGASARLTLTTLREALEQHPDYPSLLSLGDALDRFQIENAALRIDAEQLALLQVPYIAHLRTNGGMFVLVESATDSTFTYRNEKNKRIAEPRETFLQKWSGVVFIAEANEASGEKDYKAKYQKEQLENLRWPLIMAGFVLLTVVGMFQSPDLSSTLLLGLKAVGVILSALLLSVQYGKTNDFTDSLCRINQKTDCNHILTSPAAKITPWLGWSEVGFFYFMGGWILNYSSLRGEGDGGWGLMALSLLALPYTFWSIYYQWQVAKQWCPLCVAVQVVIWLECGSILLPLLIENGINFPSLTREGIQGWGLMAAAFSIPILLWLIIKPLLQKSKEADGWQRELRKFKNNRTLFETLLHQQKQMPLIPSDLQPIVLGNPTAKHTITMVTNPYCGPCAKAHIELEEVLSENPHLKAQIIFAVCYDSDGRKSKVARHLLNLTPTPLLLRGAMEAWYAQTTKDYDTWAAQYPADVSAVPDNAIAAHCEWTKTAHIEGTPTLFVDGYEVPQVYGLKQSANLLPHLNEELTH